MKLNTLQNFDSEPLDLMIGTIDMSSLKNLTETTKNQSKEKNHLILRLHPKDRRYHDIFDENGDEVASSKNMPKKPKHEVFDNLDKIQDSKQQKAHRRESSKDQDQSTVFDRLNKGQRTKVTKQDEKTLRKTAKEKFGLLPEQQAKKAEQARKKERLELLDKMKNYGDVSRLVR